MFSRRRPTPSARTVKLLYQLGYIASGTAAGLATLCLEEQRRRIKVLQRVADNAKIIRQHPRHRGNLAVVAEWDGDLEHNVVDRPWIEDPLRLRRRRQRKSEGGTDADNRNRTDGDSAKLFDEGVRNAAKTDAPRDGEGSAAHLLWQASSLENARPSSSVGYIPPPRSRNTSMHSPARNVHSSSRCLAETLTARDVSVSSGSETLWEDDGLLSRWNAVASPGSTSAPDVLGSPRTIDGKVTSFRGGPQGEQSRTSTNAQGIPSESVSGGSDSVSDALNSDAYRSRSARDRISTHLLEVALSTGSIKEIRSLCQWKIANGTFSNADARNICGSCGDLGQRIHQDGLYGLFAMLFGSEAFLNFDAGFQLEQTMIVAQHMLGWRSPLQPKDLRFKVFGNCIQYLHEDKVMQELEKCCRSLLANEQIPIAAGLVKIFADSDKCTSAVVSSIDRSFDEAIENGQLKSCISYLRWKLAVLGHESIRMQLKPFIHACGYANEEDALIEFFNSETGLGLSATLLSSQLGVDSKVILAKAFSTNDLHGDDFRRLCKSLPRSLRPSLDSLRRVPALDEMWKTTRNLNHIDGRVSELRIQLEEKEDQEALQQLEEATLEIYIEARDVDRALATVGRLRETGTISSGTLCQTALALAKMGEWSGLVRLLNLLKKLESFRFNGNTLGMFNQVISEYSQHHEPKDTWKFVDIAMQDIGFIPNRTTTEILLMSFVRHGTIELIPQWVAFMQLKSQQIWVDTQMAAVILERYCVQYRPSHILVMWLCRRLVSLSPSLAGGPLIDVVKRTIGYDLRHLDGQYETWQRDHAKERLSRVEEANDFVPSPGFVWNDRLYFPESEAVDGNLHETTDSIVDCDSSEDLKRNMWLNIGLGQYQTVLDSYHEALDPTGLPPSPDTLDAAVDASLYLHHGAPAHAEDMIAKAREAGMNTSCADVPLFIHRIRRYPPQDYHDVQKLRKFVLEHYRKNEKNRWPVSHHLATTAAHCLIIRGFVEPGVDLLRTIHESHWAQTHPFDHVTMAVMLKGYVARRRREGVRWVVETVLEQDLRITKPFMKHLKASRSFISNERDGFDGEAGLDSWIQQCNERRLQQMAATRKLGWKLVKNLAKASKEGASVDVNTVDPMEEYSIEGDGTEATDKMRADFKDEAYFSDEVERDDSIRNERYEALKARIEKDWKAEQEFREQMKAIRFGRQAKDALAGGKLDMLKEMSDDKRKEPKAMGKAVAVESESTSFAPFG